MTKRGFEVLAKNVRDSDAFATELARARFAGSLALTLKRENDSFDEGRFYTAAVGHPNPAVRFEYDRAFSA